MVLTFLFFFSIFVFTIQFGPILSSYRDAYLIVARTTELVIIITLNVTKTGYTLLSLDSDTISEIGQMSNMHDSKEDGCTKNDEKE